MRFDGPMSPEPIVIAHRGFSGERLEHTRPSYLLAIEQGADYIEPDVVATKDGVLVVRHENEVSGTTDVADRPEFADRRTTKVVDDTEHTGWFTEDFTLEELKTLRTKERIPDLRPGNVALDGVEPILTFDEVLDIALQGTATRDNPVGVYVETKHPSYFESVGISLNDLLIDALDRRGLNTPDAKITIQSFESGNLRTIRDRTPAFIVQLMSPSGAPADFVIAGDERTYADLREPAGLEFVASYADGIGPYKDLVIARDSAGNLAEPTGLVDAAHAAGLDVHIWTMRNENNFLPADLRSGTDKLAHGDAVGEYLAFYDAGVDGVFSDFTRTAVQARSRWLARQ
jgi:glycerophosphoryl diester phosphodiesterase